MWAVKRYINQTTDNHSYFHNMQRFKYILSVIVAACVCLGFEALAQTVMQVSGTVTDSMGEALPGVVIMEDGNSSNGAVVGSDGKYQISVSKGAVLSFSCIGYKTVQRTVGDSRVIDVVLADDQELLEEVVVVGYGTQKKVNLTGSVASVQFDEKMASRPVTNVSNSLIGLAAGVNVQQSSGKPGTASDIKIRGIGTINNASPLVIVDGFEWSMDNLNPADIESISILKDASSTAIYGALGANGVILITTKQGKGRVSVNYNGYVSAQTIVNSLPLVSDYADYMELVNESFTNVGQSNYYSEPTIDMWRAAKLNPNALNDYGMPNYMAYPNTDWFNVMFKTGVSHSHHIDIGGSSDKMRYDVAVGFADNPGTMNVANGVDSGQRKYTLKTNVEGTVADWLTVGASVYGSREDYGLASTANVFSKLLTTVPGIYPGEPYKYGVPASTEESTGAANLYNWLDRSGSDTRTNLSATGHFTAKIVKGLQLEGKINYQLWRRDYRYFDSDRCVTWDYVHNTMVSPAILSTAQVSDSDYKSDRLNTDLMLRYQNTFAEKHEFTALVGYSTQHYKYEYINTIKRGMASNGLTDLSAVSETLSSDGSSTEWGMASIFGRVNYVYDNRYLFEANLRYDGSSRFASKSRWGLFPSVAAGWRIGEESWMKASRSWLDELKLRASWGETGNCRTGDYAWQGTYAPTRVVLDGVATTGMILSKLANEDLKWEKTSAIDIGLDFGFFKNRLTGELDFYNKDTEGILYTPSIYMTMGIVTPSVENIAKVNNKGVELALRWKDSKGKFFYSLSGNVSYNYNMVTRYKGKLKKGWNEYGEYENNYADVSEAGFGGRICEGHMLGETYLLSTYSGRGNYNGSGEVDINAGPVDGIIRTEADMSWVEMMIANGYTFRGVSEIDRNTLWYGDVIYADSNGDGNYGDTNDFDFTGHSYTPKVNFGLNFTCGWNGIDASISLAGAAGFYLYWQNTPGMAAGYNMWQFIIDNRYFYNPENPGDSRTNINAKYPRLGTKTGGQSSNLWEYKGDFLKIKNIQIGYTLPSKITEKARISKLRIFFSADNLYTFTSFPGIDPEMGASVTYPLMKQYAGGIQLNF